MRKLLVTSGLAVIVLTGILCRKPDAAFPESNYDPRLSGGAATVFNSGSKAFGEMISGMSAYDQFVHEVGDKIFEQTFVSAPAPLYPGLGPRYNNVSCISCHHNDGKGTPTAGLPTSSLLTRISIPGVDAHGGALAAPGFGTQLQDKAIAGWTPEINLGVEYRDSVFTFPDGTQTALHRPVYTINNPYTALPAGYMTSVRLAPPVFGLGLLELVTETELLRNADPGDADGDGISGRPNYVFNPFSRQREMGRYGLKANTSSLLVQVASAFVEDMGVTNYTFRSENYMNTPSSELPDVSDSLLDAVVFYIRTLAVPARRNVEQLAVIRGEKLFQQIKCSGCHIPTLQTGVDIRLPTLSNQRIHPYTDLLLHDMGEGLADGRPDFEAEGNEWKTPALWGIGLFPKTNGTPYYLHDGRARSLVEAILWHGGEAQQAKDAFVQLPSSDRDALVKFLESL